MVATLLTLAAAGLVPVSTPSANVLGSGGSSKLLPPPLADDRGGLS